MNQPTGRDPRPRPGGLGAARWLLLALVVGGLIAAFYLDPLVFETLSAKTGVQKAEVESSDWYRFFRILGFFPTWIAVALALFAIDAARHRPHVQAVRRGVLLFAATGLAGLATEIIKLIARRARPGAEDPTGDFFIRGDGILDTSGLAFPSSHAAIAFAAAFILSFIHPRLAPLLLLLAACSGMTRIAAGAHHFSDIYASMLLSYASARFIYAWDLKNNHLPPT